MANIAQTVNVLQAVILTEGSRMLLTPTYHVFDLYKHHQDATLLSSFMETEEIGAGEYRIPNLSASASIGNDGMVNVTIANTSAITGFPVEIALEGMQVKAATAQILTGKIQDCNEFDNPDKVKPVALQTELMNGLVRFNMPACGVAMVRLRS